MTEQKKNPEDKNPMALVKLTKDMTREEKRAAVKAALEKIVSDKKKTEDKK